MNRPIVRLALASFTLALVACGAAPAPDEEHAEVAAEPLHNRDCTPKFIDSLTDLGDDHKDDVYSRVDKACHARHEHATGSWTVTLATTAARPHHYTPTVSGPSDGPFNLCITAALLGLEKSYNDWFDQDEGTCSMNVAFGPRP